MPTRKQHLSHARRSRQLYGLLTDQGAKQREWLIVLLFYAALHEIEAWLEGRGIHSGSHGQRERIVSQEPLLRPIYQQYRQLRTDSNNARYNCWQPTAGDVRAAYDGMFEPLTKHVRSLP